MSQPPQGEDPQDPRRSAPGWGPAPDQQPPGQAPGWGPPSSGWGPPSGQSGVSGGWGQPGQQPAYGSQYGQPQDPYGQYGPPGGHPPPSQYGTPGQYGAPAGYGQPGQYGAPGYGEPGPYGAPAGYGQPGQYGSPYGQYGGWEQPPPPRRRRRFGLLFWLLVLALLVGLAVTLPTRLGGTRLDPDAVQRDVAAQFEQREGVAIDLSCDQEMTVEAGRSYRCDGTTADGEQVTITIRVTDRDGDYTWSDS